MSDLIERLHRCEKVFLAQANGNIESPKYYYAEVCPRAAKTIATLERQCRMQIAVN